MRNVMFAAMALACAGAPAHAQTADRPPAVNAIVPNFYYDNLVPVRDLYVRQLGLKPVYDDGWVVILEFGPGRQLALVDGKKGFFKPVAEKGTMLSVETDELDAWYARAMRATGARWLKGREVTAVPPGLTEHKDIHEFRLVDPGGYVVEFYRWKPEFRPKR